MVNGVVVEIGEAAGVDISKAEQPPREVSRIIVSSENASKVCVEEGLGFMPVKNNNKAYK